MMMMIMMMTMTMMMMHLWAMPYTISYTLTAVLCYYSCILVKYTFLFHIKQMRQIGCVERLRRVKDTSISLNFTKMKQLSDSLHDEM
jgi:hypothetical protein